MFEDVVKGLDAAQVFQWTGRADPEEGAKKLSSILQGMVLTMLNAPMLIPDSLEIDEALAEATGLPSTKAFRLVKECLIKGGWLERANTQHGPVIMFTPKGRTRAQGLQKHLQERGLLKENGLPVSQKEIRKVKRREQGS